MESFKQRVNQLQVSEQQAVLMGVTLSILIFYFKKGTDKYKPKVYFKKWIPFLADVFPKLTKTFDNDNGTTTTKIYALESKDDGILKVLTEQNVIFAVETKPQSKLKKPYFLYELNPSKKDEIIQFLTKTYINSSEANMVSENIQEFYELNDASDKQKDGEKKSKNVDFAAILAGTAKK